MAQSQITPAQNDRIKNFFKFEGSKFNAKSNVKVHERALTQAELDAYNALRNSAEEVSLDRRIGEFPGGAYQQFTNKANQTGKVAVKDPGGKFPKPAAYAKVMFIPAGMIFPIVDRAGNPMPDMVYEQLEGDWDTTGTGTLDPTQIEDAIAYENRRRLANAGVIAEARKRQADLAADAEVQIIGKSDEEAVRALLMKWGHSAEVVATVTI